MQASPPHPSQSQNHLGRELVNLVAMLTHGMGLPGATDADRRLWATQVADANRRLDALYAGGLSRNFLHPTTRAAGEAVPPRRAGGASRPRPLCVLVVNDFERAALALARLLEREGCLVLTAGSATDALAVAAGLRVDVLVTDVGIPDVDACGLLRRLKDVYGRELPAVLLTGREEEHYVEECRREGYSQILLKPALFPQVLDAVRAAHAGRPAVRSPQPLT